MENMRKNVLGIGIEKGGCSVYERDGRIFFEDTRDGAELTEIPDAIYWDEHEGYILPDGRNLDTIVKHENAKP